MSARDLARALCTSVKSGGFEQRIVDEFAEIDSANFPLDKVFAEIRYVCGLPPARGILRAGANFGAYEARNQFLSEAQLGCLLKYLRRLLELFGPEHFRVWYGDLVHHLETSNLTLATDIAEIVEELAIKDVYMLHLCLDHHLPNPSPNSAAILAVVGDAQAETFFTELNAYIAHPQTRLAALSLLSQVAKRQGPDLHKTLSSGIFASLLLCLKNDRDVMVVTNALVALTMLLPCLCPSLAPHLTDLFGILIRLVQWRTLSTLEDCDKTDFTMSSAVPIAGQTAPMQGHANNQEKAHQQQNIAMAPQQHSNIPPGQQAPLYLPLNAPQGLREGGLSALGHRGLAVLGPGAESTGGGGAGYPGGPRMDRITPPAPGHVHGGMAGSGASTPTHDKPPSHSTDIRWLVLYETYPPESIHESGYAQLCQKLYGVLFVYFQHLYGTFPNNLFNYLHAHMQANEELRELLRPFLRSVRLNDILVGMTAEQELDPVRWRKRDANDIVAECIWLSYGVDDISVHSGSVGAANSLLDEISKTYGGGSSLPAARKAPGKAAAKQSQIKESLSSTISPSTMSASSLAGHAARAQIIGQDMMASQGLGMGPLAGGELGGMGYYGGHNNTPLTPPAISLPEHWGKSGGSLDKQFSNSPLTRESDASDSKDNHLAESTMKGESGDLLNADEEEQENDQNDRYGSRSASRASLYADNDDLTVPLDGLDAPGFLQSYHRSGRGKATSSQPSAPHLLGRDSAQRATVKLDYGQGAERQHENIAHSEQSIPHQSGEEEKSPRREKSSARRHVSSSSDMSTEMDLENTHARALHELESQIDMLKTEITFERYLKEQHIQRIRRLRRENIKIQAFQMEHASMLASQDKGLKALQDTHDRLLQENALLKAQHARWETELQAILEKYKQENVTLMAQNASLLELHGNQEAKLADMRKQLESAVSDIILLNNRCKEIAQRTVGNKDLEFKIQILQEEILRKDEQLAQKEADEKRHAEAELQDVNYLLMVESLQNVCAKENKYLKSAIQAANSKANESKAKIHDLENLLDHKEIAYKEQSRLLANVKGMGEQRIRAVEEKYDALKAVNYALESRIMELYIARDTPSGPIRLAGESDQQRDPGASAGRTESSNTKGKGPEDPTSGPLQSTSMSSFSGWLKAR